MLTPLKRRTGAHYSTFAKASQFAKAFTPRTYGARWLRPCQQKKILLTFDDGPHPEHTPKILDRLDELNARAIFFVLGREVRKHPTIVKEIVERGHLVGNHSFTHPKLPSLPPDMIRDELQRCQDAIGDVLNAEPIYFRPPYGATSVAVWRVATDMRLEIVQWSNEGGEWQARKNMSAHGIAKRLAKSLDDDQIVLLHDDCKVVVDMLADPAFRDAAQSYEMNIDVLKCLSGMQPVCRSGLRASSVFGPSVFVGAALPVAAELFAL